MDVNYRQATPKDADHLAVFVNDAGEGLPAYLWGEMAGPGESIWDVGRRRARRQEGGFSYRHATMAEISGTVAGCIIDYPAAAEPAEIDPETPPMFVPLMELENLAPGSWYLNVLAVSPGIRGKGVGSGLIANAEARAKRAGKNVVSMIASDGNPNAIRLYERLGYIRRQRRPIVKKGWIYDGENYVLLTKEI